MVKNNMTDDAGIKYRTSDDFTTQNPKPVIAVGVLIYNDNNEILLVTAPKFKDKWVICGGHLDFGETLETAAQREVKEETNLDITNIKYITHIESIGSGEFTMKKHFIFMNFAGKAINYKELKISDELTNAKWTSFSNVLQENMNASTRKTIEIFLMSRK